MVFVHGGGFLGGSGSEDAYDGTQMARRGVIVITFNYRLGPLGFAGLKGIHPNIGIEDQIFLLGWVQDNIKYFGGDQDNVTVFGHGAGATSVRCLLSVASHRGPRQLFHRAILQSAGFERLFGEPPRDYEDARDVTEQLLKEMGLEDPSERDPRLVSDTRCYLLKQAARALRRQIKPEDVDIEIPNNIQWTPVLEHEDEKDLDEGIPHTLLEAWTDDWPDVPVMMGCTKKEAWYWRRQLESIPEITEWTLLLCRRMAGQANGYFLGKPSTRPPIENIEELVTAARFLEPLLTTLNCESRRRKVYSYCFTRSSPGATVTVRGAEHTSEVPYVFGNLEIHGQGYYDQTDRWLSDVIQEA